MSPGVCWGRTTPTSSAHGWAKSLARRYAALLVPAVVKSQAARDAIINEPAVQAALDLARKSDIAFLGLGDAGSNSTMVRTGYLSPDDLADLRAQGGGWRPADTLLRHSRSAYSARHRPTHHQVELGRAAPDSPTGDRRRRTLKIPPILGVLRSGLCGTLITDTNTAQAVINAANTNS
ncbi:MAG: sugar-binding domain-containing protein [Anaerolineae bacterium]